MTTISRRHHRFGVELLNSAITSIAAALILIGGDAWAAILNVGPNESLRTVAEAAAVAKDGDTVEIAAGRYPGDVAVWTQRRLTLRGLGGKAVLEANGNIAEGKAIWVIRDGDFLVENIAFTGARAQDGNGAGIRFEKGRLSIRNCDFFDNENGVLTGSDPASELVIENSEFARAPRDRGALKHLIYIGRLKRFAMSGSRVHQGFEGHLVKSRASVSDLRYNLLVDGPDGRAAYELEFPNGGMVYAIGNVIAQSASTTNPVVIAYGAEGRVWADNALYLSHNTLSSERTLGAWFVRVWDRNFNNGVRVFAVNNLTIGLGLLSLAATGQFQGNIPGMSWLLGDMALLDFTLGRDSWLRGIVSRAPNVDGTSLVPDAEFVFPRGTRSLGDLTVWAPGAFQRSNP